HRASPLWRLLMRKKVRSRPVPRSSPPHCARLRLESLEERCVPAVDTVLNLNASGVGSLSAVLAAAASGDTIEVASGLSGTITPAATLTVANNVTIEGPGAGVISVSGNNANRVFAINAGVTATISGLTITKGSVTANESGPLSLGGGGILNETGSVLTLTQCTLSNNTATASSATVDVFGGGLLNEGTATVNSCTFSGNEATGGGGTSF